MRILFLDEAIFSHTTGPSKAWSNTKDNLTVDEASFNMQPLALTMAVSIDRGVDHFDICKRSVRNEEFVNFLKDLRLLNGCQ